MSAIVAPQKRGAGRAEDTVKLNPQHRTPTIKDFSLRLDKSEWSHWTPGMDSTENVNAKTQQLTPTPGKASSWIKLVGPELIQLAVKRRLESFQAHRPASLMQKMCFVRAEVGRRNDKKLFAGKRLCASASDYSRNH